MARAKEVQDKPEQPIIRLHVDTTSSSPSTVSSASELEEVNIRPARQATPPRTTTESPVLIELTEDEEEVQTRATDEMWTCNRNLQEFCKWLEGPDVDKHWRTARGHASQVFAVLRTLDHALDPNAILDVEAVKCKWMTPFKESHQPGTIKSYVGSIILFLDFLLAKRVISRRTEATAAISELRRLVSVMRKRSLRRRTEREAQDLESIITPAKVTALLSAPQIRAIEELLKNPSLTTDNIDVYNRVRNYVMFRVLLANGQRPGVLSNISPASIEKARLTPDGAVLTIAKHKTGYMAPANVAFPQPLWRYVLAYLHLLRSLPGYDAAALRRESIFLSFQGGLDHQPTPIPTQTMHKGLNSLWHLVHKDSSISATLLRKSVVTHVREAEPMSREVLAKHMSHQPSTADRYYQLHQARSLALPVAKLISHTMEQPSCSQEAVPEIEAPPTTSLPSSSQEVPGSVALEVAPGEESHSDEPEVVPPTPPRKRISQVGIHKRRSFEPEDARRLIELCEPLYGQAISLTIVMTHLMGTPQGLALLARLQCSLGANWRKQIVDRVRAEYRKRKRAMH